MASDDAAVLNLLADFFDELSDAQGLWSDEIGQFVVSKQEINDLANRYAGQIEGALARHDTAGQIVRPEGESRKHNQSGVRGEDA